jgi:hypothetical protein
MLTIYGTGCTKNFGLPPDFTSVIVAVRALFFLPNEIVYVITLTA